MIRDPRGGRNYETYSEDPVVLGVLGAAFVNGKPASIDLSSGRQPPALP
jgi:beta-glucosidase-like glycosyl hydrolase